MSFGKVNPEVRSTVEDELWKDERLLWADKNRKLVFSWMDKYLLGFSIFWLVLVTFLFLPQLTSGQETHEITINAVPTEVSFTDFLLFVSIFPAFGIFMLVGVLSASKIRTGQIYAVTDKRSLFISSFLKRSVTSFPHEKVFNIQRFGKNDLGSLKFQKQEESKWFSFQPDWFLEMNTFSGILNPKFVEELILSLQKEEKMP